MAGISPAFIFLHDASIYAFLDLALDLVNLVFWGGVWTPVSTQTLQTRV